MRDPAQARSTMHALLQRERHGVLSTLHHQFADTPFGSIAPYALTADLEPVFLFSSIAEHTKNLVAHPRASLLVQDSQGGNSPLAHARLTVLGTAIAPTGAAQKALLDAYLARFPEAVAYTTAHDFRPFVLRVERVRWIAGFGAMGWLDQAQWR
jgi:putative heme iron utilization protein